MPALKRSSAMLKRRSTSQSAPFVCAVLVGLAFASWQHSSSDAFTAPPQHAVPTKSTLADAGVQEFRRGELLLRSPYVSADRLQKVHAPTTKSKVGPLNAGPVAATAIAVGLGVLGTWATEAAVPGLPDSIGVRRFLHIPVKWLTRWNERWFGPVNFDRANLRILAMDTYAICASFLLQIVMALFTTINGQKPDSDAPRMTQFMYDFQVFFASAAMMFSTWTMIMFLFNKVYAVKAIAIYQDVNYDVFVKATRRYRVRAFQSLIASLFTFIIAYGAVLYTTMGGAKGAWCFILSCLFGVAMGIESFNLIRDARVVAGMRT